MSHKGLVLPSQIIGEACDMKVETARDRVTNRDGKRAENDTERMRMKKRNEKSEESPDNLAEIVNKIKPNRYQSKYSRRSNKNRCFI